MGIVSRLPVFFVTRRIVPGLVHQVRGWYSGAAAYFGWMREAKRDNTRCGLRPMSDKAAGRKTRGPEGCDENGPAAALLLGHVSISDMLPPTASPARTALPAAHFDRNAAIPVTDLVH